MKIEVGIYIHIPFCERKCSYCDFNSYEGLQSLHDAYVDALCHDMARLAANGCEAGVRYVARTLFFGGGTPTLLQPHHFERLLGAVEEKFGWDHRVETTTEANPGTLNLELIRRLRELGVNRISLGVQSFDDNLLASLGRIHNSKQAKEAIDLCRKSGFDNINLDLMYGLPDQSYLQWRQTIDQACAFSPEHLSLYPLTIEDGTPFSTLLQLGKLRVPSDDETAEMYNIAELALAAQYEHYELSNWSKKDSRVSRQARNHRCEHNLVYWHNEQYVGLGAGAHSFLHSIRSVNASAPAEYIRRLEMGHDPVETTEPISHTVEMAEYLILGLRLSEGVGRASFRTRFSRELDDVVGDVFLEAQAKGLACDNGESIFLSDHGRFLSNEVFVPILDHLKATGD
jgi:oxygen-independent coproporphyrinogen-3 oxidase